MIRTISRGGIPGWRPPEHDVRALHYNTARPFKFASYASAQFGVMTPLGSFIIKDIQEGKVCLVSLIVIQKGKTTTMCMVSPDQARPQCD